jgi:hypothetical protein
MIIDQRFYHVDPDRCYRNIRLPFLVKHDESVVTASKTHSQRFFYENSIDLKLKQWAEDLGILLNVGRIFKNYPYQNYIPHVDKDIFGDQSVAINFAFNDKDTVFSWHTLKTNVVPEHRPNSINVPLLMFENKDCRPVLSTEIDHEPGQPFLINKGYIHSLRVGPSYRFCYSYSLKKIRDGKDLQWDEAVDLIKKYIIN